MFESIQFAALIGVWFLCPILIALILLQGGGDMGSAFGGGGQLDSSLGVGAVRKISKITGWLSLLFMVCVVLVAIRTEGHSVDALRQQTGLDGSVVESDDAPPAELMNGDSAAVEETDAPAEVAPDATDAGDAPVVEDAPADAQAPADGEASAEAPAPAADDTAPAVEKESKPVIEPVE